MPWARVAERYANAQGRGPSYIDHLRGFVQHVDAAVLHLERALKCGPREQYRVVAYPRLTAREAASERYWLAETERIAREAGALLDRLEAEMERARKGAGLP